MTAAEHIQPEQDYADLIAEACSLAEDQADRDALAALIRSTLREEATEAWGIFDRHGVMVDIRTGALPKRARRHGYTVRRVLVLESHD